MNRLILSLLAWEIFLSAGSLHAAPAEIGDPIPKISARDQHGADYVFTNGTAFLLIVLDTDSAKAANKKLAEQAASRPSTTGSPPKNPPPTCSTEPQLQNCSGVGWRVPRPERTRPLASPRWNPAIRPARKTAIFSYGWGDLGGGRAVLWLNGLTRQPDNNCCYSGKTCDCRIV